MLNAWRWHRSWLATVVLAALAVPSSAALAQTAEEIPAPHVETWIREQLDKGEEADLAAQFRDLNDRRLSSAFLLDLLKGNPSKGLRPAPHGVHIKHAIFPESVDLQDLQADMPLSLTYSHFKRGLNLTSAQLKGNFSVEGSLFDGPATFSQAHAQGHFAVDDATFHDVATFTKTSVEGEFLLQNARFLAKVGYDLSDVQAKRNLVLSSAIFDGPVQLDKAQISQDLRAQHATFGDAVSGLSMLGLSVGGSALFDDARFSGPFLVDGHVGQSATFVGSRFSYVTDRPDPRHRVSFASLSVGQDFALSGSTIAGQADLSRSSVKGELNLDGVKFEHPQQAVNFNTLDVGTYLFMRDGTEFHGPVDFSASRIGINLDAPGIHFLGPGNRLDFSGVRVDKNVFFNRASFEGQTSFQAIDAGQITLDRASFEGPVSFFGANVRQQLFAQYTTFGKCQTATMAAMKVGDLGGFLGAVFAGPIDLSASTFARLDLRQTIWPDPQSSCLDADGHAYHPAARFGMTYQSIAAGPPGAAPEADRWDVLHDLLAGAVYDARDYVRAESFLKSGGHPEAGDQAFMAAQDQEGARATALSRPAMWLKDVLIGYGRQPWKALLIGAVIVLLTYAGLVFSISRGIVSMQPRDPQPGRPAAPFRTFIDGFWYSLDVFAPVISLKTRDEWRIDRCAFDCAEKLLSILGWVIVPLGVAAITGLVK